MFLLVIRGRRAQAQIRVAFEQRRWVFCGPISSPVANKPPNASFSGARVKFGLVQRDRVGDSIVDLWPFLLKRAFLAAWNRVGLGIERHFFSIS